MSEQPRAIWCGPNPPAAGWLLITIDKYLSKGTASALGAPDNIFNNTSQETQG